MFAFQHSKYRCLNFHGFFYHSNLYQKFVSSVLRVCSVLFDYRVETEIRVLSNWPAHMTIWRALIIDLLFSLISVSPYFKLKKNLSIYSSIIPKTNRLLYLAERGHNIAIQRSHSQKIPIQWQFHQKGLDLFLEVIHQTLQQADENRLEMEVGLLSASASGANPSDCGRLGRPCRPLF